MTRILPDSANLEDLAPLEDHENIKSAAYKTVDMFAGICQRRLWMKHVANATPSTDGTVITVDLNDDCMYQEVEHEISHILFQSDNLAKARFIRAYSKRIQEFAVKQGTPLNISMLELMLGEIINILEDQRVCSLWGQLYPGSIEILLSYYYDRFLSKVPQAHKSFLSFFHFLALGVPVPPGPCDQYRSIFETALKQVHQRGFLATLVVSKWLVTALIDRLIQNAVTPPPPPVASVAPQADPGTGSDAGQSSLDPGINPSEGQTNDLTILVDAAQGKEPAKAGPPAQGGQAGGSSNNNGTDSQQRAQAMGLLVQQVTNNPTDDELKDIADDVVDGDPKYRRYGVDNQADKLAQQALNTDVKDGDAVQQALAKSQSDMENLVQQTKQAIRQALNYDDWLVRDSLAKVVVNDVTPADNIAPAPLSIEDLEAVRRLRAVFFRVLGKVRTRLESDGTEVDVQAYIEHEATHTAVPCFRQAERGRGFKALILLDRSGSMGGDKTVKAERACRIIQRALKFPFVEFGVWGFNSLENGQVNIVRFDPDAGTFSGEHAEVGGLTPLHTAVRVGIRHLEAGRETKQLFILTDGQPMYNRRDGKGFSSGMLMLWTRDSIRMGRRHGINTTCVMIDPAMDDKWVQMMFGSPRYWRKISKNRMGDDIVKLISGSFISYLQNR